MDARSLRRTRDRAARRTIIETERIGEGRWFARQKSAYTPLWMLLYVGCARRGRWLPLAMGGEMDETTTKEAEATSALRPDRVQPTSAPPEAGHLIMLLIALISFAAALYSLWLVANGAGLTTPACLVALQTSSTVELSRQTAPPTPWASVVIFGMVAIGLLWLSTHLLGKASEVAAGRRLLGIVERLAVPDAVKLQVALTVSGCELSGPAPIAASLPDPAAARTLAAGKWVLDRFAEGASVVAMPESLAEPEHLRRVFGTSAAAGQSEGLPITILRPDAQEGAA
jgi:hypothetical protein